MYSLDERIPVCKECCKTSVLSDDGRIDFDKFKDLLRNIDKPLYFDLLFSSDEKQQEKEKQLYDKKHAEDFHITKFYVFSLIYYSPQKNKTTV